MVRLPKLTALEIIVMAITIVGLVAVLLPLTNYPNRRSGVSKCATQLKAIGETISVYAATWNDKLPISKSFEGSWWCDVSADAILQGPPNENYYCPQNPNQETARRWAGSRLNYRPVGYVFICQRSPEDNLPLPVRNGNGPPMEMYHNWYTTPFPSEAELAADWIISDTPTARASTNWIGWKSSVRAGVYDTSHVRNNKPNGANVLNFDGGVRWRTFPKDTARTLTLLPTIPGTGSPNFWIINP